MTQTPALPHPARPIWWRWAWNLRHLPDRLLHSLRRQHAIRWLSDTPGARERARRVSREHLPQPLRRVPAAGAFRSSRSRVYDRIGGVHRTRPALSGKRDSDRGVTRHRPQTTPRTAAQQTADRRRAAHHRDGGPPGRRLRMVFGQVNAPILILGDVDPRHVETRTVRDPGAAIPRGLRRELRPHRPLPPGARELHHMKRASDRSAPA